MNLHYGKLILRTTLTVEDFSHFLLERDSPCRNVRMFDRDRDFHQVG